MAGLPQQAWRLVLDASHPQVFVGILGETDWIDYRQSDRPALNAIFGLTDTLMTAHDLRLSRATGFVHCSGPGSTLGIRIAAMAIRTWTAHNKSARIYAYHSLSLMRATLEQAQPEVDCHLIADWKKGAWHHLAPGSRDIAFLPTEELSNLPQLYHLAQRKGWQRPPEHAIPLDYSPETLPQALQFSPELLSEVDAPTVFQHTAPSFPKWTPQRHR